MKMMVLQELSMDQTDMAKSDLAAELQKIRKQYEVIAAENIAKFEMLYKNQVTQIHFYHEQTYSDEFMFIIYSCFTYKCEFLRTTIRYLKKMY